MRNFLIVVVETFLLLRRDKIFYPTVLALLAISILAQIVSEWGIEEFDKILFDLGLLGFHLFGNFIALFWGVKIIQDSASMGTVEVQLAAPISRFAWINGKYVGLCCCLLVIGAIITGLWQVMMLLNGLGIMSSSQLLVFLLQELGWMVVASIALFFASFSGFAVAIFSALGVFILGLSLKMVSMSLPVDSSLVIKELIGYLAHFFDLQRFNLTFTDLNLLPAATIFYIFAYGFGLIGIFIVLANMIFYKRDLIG